MRSSNARIVPATFFNISPPPAFLSNYSEWSAWCWVEWSTRTVSSNKWCYECCNMEATKRKYLNNSRGDVWRTEDLYIYIYVYLKIYNNIYIYIHIKSILLCLTSFLPLGFVGWNSSSGRIRWPLRIRSWAQSENQICVIIEIFSCIQLLNDVCIYIYTIYVCVN